MRPRTARRAALVAAAAVLLPACGGFLDPPAATVHGKRIETGAVSALTELFERSDVFEQASGQGDPDSVLRQYEQEVLGQLVRAEVMRRAARALGVDVDDGEVDEGLQEVRAQFGSDEEFEDAVAARGLTRSRLRALVSADVLERAVRAEVTRDSAPSEDDLRAYYDDNIADYASVRLEHIQLSDDGLARRLSARLRSAPSGRVDALFARLADEHSEDRASAAEGGDVGFVPLSAFPEDFRSALDALGMGEVSRPLQSPAGWHVVRITDRRVESFEDARDAIAQTLEDQGAEESWQTYVRDLYRAADIDIDPKYGRLDIASQTVVNLEPSDAPGAGAPSERPQR